ncbi:hypothetical protein [Spirosoma areae]
MKTKPKSPTPKSATPKKPDGRPKVKLGTGRNVLFTSDTLFDDDLK